VSVDHAPAHPVRTFATLGLPALLVKALGRGGIKTPTAVQAAVIPDALAGRDILGRAATGSGKTFAFGLPILTRLAGSASSPKSPRALIVVPTRELAGQVRSALEPTADALGVRIATVYGGTPYDRQIKRLRAGADLVVATPGRLADLIEKGACRLDRVEITVLDEADHLCDLGFFPAVSELVAMTPAGGQRMLLSATLDGDVDRLVRRFLVDPVTHDCDPDSERPQMEHHVIVTGTHDKVGYTADLLRANPRSIVFTRTRQGATNLARELEALGVSTVDLHGMLSQGARERNLRRFRSGQADVVVATDVAARGIHVDSVSLVVHYDAPTERKSYVHRSGRTARAGHPGTVVTMTTTRQLPSVTRMQKAAGVSARQHDAHTEPKPMTAESLAMHGVAGSDIEVPRRSETDRGQGRRAVGAGSHRNGTAPRRASVPPAGPRATGSGRGSRPDRRPRTQLRAAPSRKRSDMEVATVARPYRPAQTEPRRRPSRVEHKPVAGRTPNASGKVKKPRWSAAERRAGSRR
jgi:superfamily II DNA/RNA helicase